MGDAFSFYEASILCFPSPMAWISTKPAFSRGPLQGVAAIVVAVFLLSLSDGLVKLAGDAFGLGQIVLLRSLVAAGLVAAGLLAVAGPSALRSGRTGWVCARSLSLAAMWLSYYAALPSISLALAAACYYTAPAWMALMSRLLLGTIIGRRGWAAIGLSMAGVIVTVDPAPGTLSPVLLLPVAAGAFYALAGIITWSRCRDESAGAMALNLNLCLCAVAGIGLVVLAVVRPPGEDGFVLAIWPTLRPADWGLVFLLGGLMAIIATTVALAYSLAPTPVVGVFDTAYLGFAALWGVALFGDALTWREGVGLAVIAAGAVMASGGAARGAAGGAHPVARAVRGGPARRFIPSTGRAGRRS